MEKDIKILEEFKTKGYSMLLMKYGDRNTTNLKIEQALENLIKGYRKLKLENQALENTKNTCPMMNTSGIRCNAKERIKHLEERLKWKTDNTNKLIEVTNLYLDSIPKSLIKEKIDKLKETADEDNLDDFIRIQVLEELLKGE